MKFLFCVGAEKAGTTWLYHYFRSHTEYIDLGKELNLIQRDDLVPDLEGYEEFRSDISLFFNYVSYRELVTGDFTHYEGSTENIFRLYKDELEKRGVEVVPVYIMRDPISRSWSAWNMLGGGDTTMPKAAEFVMSNYISCKYKETIQALDNVFPNPIYLFYENMFKQETLDLLCDALEIQRHDADLNTRVGEGSYDPINEEFINKFGKTDKNIAAAKYIFERFENVPWNIEDYT